jgi:histidyl-tRNA synthetase
VAKLQPVRGTHDLLPDDARRHIALVETARAVTARYGYAPVETPIFEFSEVFRRTLGDTSDIVTKEMYSFTDKGGDEITLRPEGTAGVARAFMSNGLTQELPLRLFYAGPMFRYERPQKGRMRQFHQIGVELLGVPEPQGDVEVIAAGKAVLDALGLAGRVTLELNTLGDAESRENYRGALVSYLAQHADALSEDSRERLGRNPLRILDSKDEGDRAIVADAPSFADYLSDAARAFFAEVTESLAALGISYRLNSRLVRGLDYYCHTAFEFTTEELGAQGTVLAGGRYDGLVGMMGGPETAGVGWAAGIERLVLMMDAPPPPPRPVAVIPVGDAAAQRALVLAEELRRAGVAVDLAYRGNLKRRMARANKVQAIAAVILGEDELAAGEATLRDLDSGEQRRVALEALIAELAPGDGPK